MAQRRDPETSQRTSQKVVGHKLGLEIVERCMATMELSFCFWDLSTDYPGSVMATPSPQMFSPISLSAPVCQ